MANHPALVAITPQTPHQNSISFIKNITTRSSFCGTPTSMNHSLVSNRKSWNGNGTLPLQAANCHIDISPIEDNPPVLASFKSGTGTFPRKNYSNNQRDADSYHSRDNNQRILTNFASQRSSNNGNATPSFEFGEETNVEGRHSFNNGDHEVLTPNGNSVAAAVRANEKKRGAGNARRYAEIGNWSARSSTFLEPHIQGVGWRTAPDSDRGQEDHSTEDDEQLLIKEDKPSHQTKKPFIFHRDIQDTSESEREHKSRAEQLRERFEQKQASRKDEVDGNRPQDRRSQEVENVKRMAKEFLENSMKDEGRGRDGNQKNARNDSTEFRPIPAADFRDSLSQSRESLSSRNSAGAGGSDADVDCECDSSGGSCSGGSGGSGSGSGSGSERVPCDIGLLERLLRTHPVWFLPGIQRAGAFHLLQGKEEGNFVVRQSSQTDTMALSVRLPVSAGPYIEHYLIHAAAGRIGLETSQNKFDNIPDLVAHYSQCCDELPVQLVLPRALRDAKNRQQLSSLALLGQEFWRYPMACPRPGGTLKGEAQPGAPTPMSQTPSDTSSSFSSFSAGIPRTPRPAEADSNIVLNLTPVDNPCGSGGPGLGCSMSTFKGTSSPPGLAVSRLMGAAHEGGAFIRAPRPTPPNTLNLLSSTAHITHQSSPAFPQTPLLFSQGGKTLPPPPPPRWAKPPFNNNNNPTSNEIQSFVPSAKSQSQQISAGANITVTTTVTFSVNNQNNSPCQNALEELLSPNTDSVKSNSTNNNNSFDDGHSSLNSSSNFCQTTSKRLSPEGECINILPSSLQSSLRRRQGQDPTSGIVSPSPQTTPFSPEPIINSFNSKNGVFSSTNLVPSPNGSNSVTSGIFSPSQINSPLSNTTMSSKSGIFSSSQVTSPALNKSELFSPLSRSSPISAKSSVFSPVSHQNSFTNNSAFNSPLMGKDRERILSPNTNTVSTTTSGRSRKSKHSHRKESRHYQESDILESPGVYYRSSLGDKASDYEDIWGPEQGGPQGPARSTFRPQKDALGSGMLISKRPDLLPDTLPKVTSLNSNILSPSSPITTDNDSDKEHHQFMALKLAAQQNLALQNSLESAEKVSMIIATTNSKGEPVPKRPDKLNLMKNANEQMTHDTNERLKQSEFIGRTDEEIELDNHKKNISNDECLLLTNDFCNSTDDDLQTEKQNSPFYADPVDAIKEAVVPLVQRRRVVRGMPGISPAQRYSEPPTNGHPYLPLRDMQSIEELSPSSPNTSSSVDNLAGMKSGRPRGKAVLPPRIKPVPARQDQTWTVDSSWEFISKQGDMTPLQSSGCREGGDAGVHGSAGGGAFPSLTEQLTRLDSAHHGDMLTIHQVLAQRFPELNLSPYPTMLKSSGEVESSHDPPEDLKGCRMSSYDNVENRLAVSSQASDDGTVFNEPWDCSHWDRFLPPRSNDDPLSILSSHTYDAEEDDSSTARERSVTPPNGEAPIRLATISRAKSFRDRLDPLLAPPRLQALRGSRGRASAPGTPGEPVRVYAMHLAADKTTTFAQNVDNFISCTIDSKETCPHVVMRNMRQFMSGMKNYLVKHGEREFEREVEKERLKLKADEFLNLDAILEGVLHGAVVTPLRSHVYGLLADKFAKRGDVAQLTMGMRTAKTLPLLRLGVRASVRVPLDSEMVVISQYFVRMQEADSPLDKLENLLSAISAIFNSMKSSSCSLKNPIGADDFLPVLVMILARCNVAGVELEAELMAGLLPPQLLAGEGGYYLTTLFGAVAVLKRLASSDDQKKTLDWHTGSLASGMTSAVSSCTLGGGGVARVMVPDESSGALRFVALPWRPGARARDLCRQLAHMARITNPQDYGLFALRDGEETLMNDTDYPQDLVENNKGNCMLAYKRIDAKIAWPKQALQSYP